MTTATLPAPASTAPLRAPPAGPAAPPPSASLRFTRDGDDALERHLGTTCARIAAGLRGLIPAGRLEAVLLGGGYGRGEGGVLHTPEGDLPYNDAEFYVFLRGDRRVNERRFGRALHVFGEILTPQAGVEVEFRVSSLGELAADDVTMYSYDLVSGHRWLIGDEPKLGRCDHHRDARRIPLSEATRLLMNRCTGLLLAQERLGRQPFTPADADFVARNIAKAQLAAGDAVLTALGGYHWQVEERHARLMQIAGAHLGGWAGPLCAAHATAVEFKLHPTRSSERRPDLALRHALVSKLCRDVWLWLEGRRLNAGFEALAQYVDPRIEKWPELAGRRAVLANARVFGARALGPRHPRERLLNTLPLLLWDPRALTVPATLRHLQRELRTTAGDFAGLLAAYRQIWEKVN